MYRPRAEEDSLPHRPNHHHRHAVPRDHHPTDSADGDLLTLRRGVGVCVVTAIALSFMAISVEKASSRPPPAIRHTIHNGALAKGLPVDDTIAPQPSISGEQVFGKSTTAPGATIKQPDIDPKPEPSSSSVISTSASTTTATQPTTVIDGNLDEISATCAR